MSKKSAGIVASRGSSEDATNRRTPLSARPQRLAARWHFCAAALRLRTQLMDKPGFASEAMTAPKGHRAL